MKCREVEVEVNKHHTTLWRMMVGSYMKEESLFSSPKRNVMNIDDGKKTRMRSRTIETQLSKRGRGREKEISENEREMRLEENNKLTHTKAQENEL